MCAIDVRFCSETTVVFPSARLAGIAFQTLDVDKELRGDELTREMKVDDCVLHAKFEAHRLKVLRVALNGFYESLKLTIDSMRRMDTKIDSSTR